MLFKTMALFLVVMAVLAMFGKLRLPGQKGKGPRATLRAPGTRRCKACGRPQMGRGPCPCATK